jgi:hypothetical protein
MRRQLLGLLVVGAATAGAQQRDSTLPAFLQADTTACAAPSTDSARAADTARAPASARQQPTASSTGERGPTIVLWAAATAREVRFAAQPRIRVRLCGAVMDSVRVVERRNLPERVQPGVTYRDVYVAVEILGHLNAQCLAARLGGAARADLANCAFAEGRDSVLSTPRRVPP